ncbi:MAG: M23 family metallopeptidase [Verrucomicrobia bacterium]|nr:M23 family metallopeptidase [Verrucomicrobiota bacterium]
MSTLIQRLLLAITLGALAAQPHCARAQSADAPAHRDPKKVIDDALTRIFDGGSETPAGDSRSLELTASEHAAANHAGRMFNTLEYAPGYGYADASIYDPGSPDSARHHIDRLREVLTRQSGQTALSASAIAEIRTALVPFVWRLSIDAQLSSGTLVVPPKTKCRIKLRSYCMDKDWPAPRQGEKMQLVPVQTLLPGNLSVLYRRLVQQAASDASTRAQLQGLVWTLRQIAQDPKGSKPVTLSQRQREILESAHPNGYAYFQMLRQPLGRSSLPEELESLVRQEVGDAIGGLGEQGEFAVRSIPNDRMADVVAQQLERISAMPVTAPIPNNNSHYTKLAENVYARTVYGSVEVQVANASDNEFILRPAEYVAQSERQVQRMGPAVPPVAPFPSSVEEAIGIAAEMLSGQETAEFTTLYPLLTRDADKEVDNHTANALDIFAERGKPVFPIAKGRVTMINREGIPVGSGTTLTYADDPGRGLGKYVIIRHTVDGSSVWSCYGHLESVNPELNEDQEISLFTTLGYVGDTGSYSGSVRRAHLHIQIDTVQPWNNPNITHTDNKQNFPCPPYYETHPSTGQSVREVTLPVIRFLESHGTKEQDTEGVISYDRLRYLKHLVHIGE